MAYHHRSGDRIVLRYRQGGHPYHGQSGVVLVRARPGRRLVPGVEWEAPPRSAPLNFSVQIDSGLIVVVPAGHLHDARRPP